MNSNIKDQFKKVNNRLLILVKENNDFFEKEADLLIPTNIYNEIIILDHNIQFYNKLNENSKDKIKGLLCNLNCLVWNSEKKEYVDDIIKEISFYKECYLMIRLSFYHKYLSRPFYWLSEFGPLNIQYLNDPNKCLFPIKIKIGYEIFCIPYLKIGSRYSKNILLSKEHKLITRELLLIYKKKWSETMIIDNLFQIINYLFDFTEIIYDDKYNYEYELKQEIINDNKINYFIKKKQIILSDIYKL